MLTKKFLLIIIFFTSINIFSNEQKIIQIINYARRQINTPGKTSANGKNFNMDCSGFTSMVFYANKIDLLSGVRSYGSNMVATLFHTAIKRGDYFHRQMPLAGDIVFFDNTYDANRDGVRNDLLTHVGVVEKTDGYGNVYYIHRVNPAMGIKRYVLNIKYPNVMYANIRGKKIKVNDYIASNRFSGKHLRGFIRLNQFNRN